MDGALRTRAGRLAAAAFLCALALAAGAGLAGCKSTDFFTEIILSNYAEDIYEDADPTPLNSPEAENENNFSALDWSDDASQSDETENLVVYSSEPNTDLTSHHSAFDLYPKFPGTQASDGVRLKFAADAEPEGRADADPDDEQEEEPETEEKSTGGELSEEALEALEQAAEEARQSEEGGSVQAGAGDGDGEGGEGDGEGEGTGEGESSGGEGADADASGSGEGAEDAEGTGTGDYSGYSDDPDDITYDASDGFAKVQQADSLAVLGTQAAVMAQALGGEGAVCAMSEYAWEGRDAGGGRGGDSTAMAFCDVFADEVSEGDIAFWWEEDGSDPSDISDIEELIEACGEDGVIVYETGLGDASELFSSAQTQALAAHGYQLVPVDLSTVQGMQDAALAIGEALSESPCAQDAESMADAYCDAIDDIVSEVAEAHGGTLASKSGGKTLLTTYNGCPVKSYQTADVYCYVATMSETGLAYDGDEAVDASGIVLFGALSDTSETPLWFWKQVAGLWDYNMSSNSYAGSYVAYWPLNALQYVGTQQGKLTTSSGSTLTGGSSGGALALWQSSTYQKVSSMPAVEGAQAGLGTASEPYLVICASDGRSASGNAELVLESMASYKASGTITPYSVFHYASTYLPSSSTSPYAGKATDSTGSYFSTIGAKYLATSQWLSSEDVSPFDNGLSADDVVRENPCGLLGSWTEGTFECVLEAAWLMQVYSESPEGCDYEPISDLEDYSVTIGGTECTSFKQTVVRFYRYFYRYSDASDVYDDVVSDDGL